VPFIDKTEDGYSIDDSSWSEHCLINVFSQNALHGLFQETSRKIVYGVPPGEDFGYFTLGDRFWRAALVIYFVGVSDGFWERGVGYAELWLFNARHAIELYIKGQLFVARWFQDLQSNPLRDGCVAKSQGLAKDIRNKHDIWSLYSRYKEDIHRSIDNWDCEALGDLPDINKLLLSLHSEQCLNELGNCDEDGFTFRYPNIKKQDGQALRMLDWSHDESELFSETGLPRKHGVFFDHIKVMNELHSIMTEFKAIECYMSACSDYIGARQDWAKEQLNDL